MIDRFDLVRMLAGELAGEDAAEAPADDRIGLFVAEAVDPLAEAVERVGAGAEVPAHLPAVDAKAGRGERAAQASVVRSLAQEAGDDQHRRAVLGPRGPRLAKWRMSRIAFQASSRRWMPVGGASSPSQTGRLGLAA